MLTEHAGRVWVAQLTFHLPRTRKEQLCLLFCCLCAERWQLKSNAFLTKMCLLSLIYKSRALAPCCFLVVFLNLSLSCASPVPRGWWHHCRHHGYQLYAGVQQQLWWQIVLLISVIIVISPLWWTCWSHEKAREITESPIINTGGVRRCHGS